MQSTNVKNDAEVREGDIIGYVGNTGRSEAPHVHYEIQQKNESGQWKQINPVIGDQDKVTPSDIIDLKDPQIMINNRDGVTSIKQSWQNIKENWKSIRQTWKEIKENFDKLDK